MFFGSEHKRNGNTVKLKLDSQFEGTSGNNFPAVYCSFGSVILLSAQELFFFLFYACDCQQITVFQVVIQS